MILVERGADRVRVLFILVERGADGVRVLFILVERGADGVRVLFWYHRQFYEAAVVRSSTELHRNIAEYFMGTWANGKQIYR